MARKEPVLQWLNEPEIHDYPAAKSYLSLLFVEAKADALVKKLKRSPVVEFKAKDIFRAAALPLLGLDNSHVAKDRRKLDAGEKVSPLLLVRDSSRSKVIIADGYHRLCAVYSLAEDAMIRCKIV